MIHLRRTWFRFSLRTVFVLVTLLCCWLALQVRRVHQREATIQSLAARGVVAIRKDPCQPLPTIPVVRSFLGDEPVAIFDLHDVGFDEREAQLIANTFPEARVYLNGEQPLHPSWLSSLY
jgi:hypothetical protein